MRLAERQINSLFLNDIEYILSNGAPINECFILEWVYNQYGDIEDADINYASLNNQYTWKQLREMDLKSMAKINSHLSMEVVSNEELEQFTYEEIGTYGALMNK